MPLVDQYPDDYAAWVAGGGVENNFRAHLLGTGKIKATPADWQFMFGQIMATLNQIKGMMENSGSGG